MKSVTRIPTNRLAESVSFGSTVVMYRPSSIVLMARLSEVFSISQSGEVSGYTQITRIALFNALLFRYVVLGVSQETGEELGSCVASDTQQPRVHLVFECASITPATAEDVCYTLANAAWLEIESFGFSESEIRTVIERANKSLTEAVESAKND